MGYEPKTLRIETSSPTTRPVGIFSLEVYPVKMAPEGFNFSNEGKKSEGAKDSSEKKSKDTKVSSGNVKHKLKCTQVKKRKVWKESPLVEKSQSKKKKIHQAKSPKVESATSDSQLQSPVVDSAGRASIGSGKTNSVTSPASTASNHELHALLQHVYAKAPLDNFFWKPILQSSAHFTQKGSITKDHGIIRARG